MLNAQAITEFSAALRGRVVQPGDADYDAARRVYNAMIDRHPRLIVHCRDVADVITASTSPASRRCCWRCAAAATTAAAWASATTAW